jgi:hypothetical protein
MGIKKISKKHIKHYYAKGEKNVDPNRHAIG